MANEAGPLSTASHPQKSASVAAAPRRVISRCALVIDDDEIVCDAIASELKSLGVVQVSTAYGDAATVRMINERGPYDLIITDLAMPKFDGLQLTRLIAARQPGARMVYVSGGGSKTLAAASALATSRGLQVLGALQKPVSLKELFRILEKSSIDDVPPPARILPAPKHAVAAASEPEAKLEPMPFGRLLDRLGPIRRLEATVATVRAQTAGVVSSAILADAADQLGAAVQQHCAKLEADRAGVVSLLDQVTSGLEAVSGHLSRDALSRRDALDENVSLGDRLLGEVSGLDADIRQASDLVALQDEVRTRLDRISGSLQQAQSREQERMREFEQRAEQMKQRIDQLENETRALTQSVAREHEAASTDPLTGIPNRLSYDQRLQQVFAQWKRHGGNLVVGVWDIDRFKRVNDTYGHAAGDKALRAVGQHLAAQVRETDYLARYGGEEFVMILHGSSVEAAMGLAEKLRMSVSRLAFQYNQQPVPITVSCGLTSFAGADTPESVFERADAALYQAKNNGRNCCVAG